MSRIGMWILAVLGLAGLCCPRGIAATVTQICASENQTIVLRSNGTVWGWGNGDSGQLGDVFGLGGDFGTLRISGFSDIRTISAGPWDTMGVRGDGTLWYCGCDCSKLGGKLPVTQHSSAVQVADVSGVKSVAVGNFYAIFVKTDGTVWAWGQDNGGVLGNGMQVMQQAAPAQIVGLSGIVAVATCESHALALKNNGTVWAWGDGGQGQLGIGRSSSRNVITFQVPGLTGVTAIAVGRYHSMALKDDGTVWAWGLNDCGQVGNGENIQNIRSPVQVSGLSGVKAISAGLYHSVALKRDGTVWTWGYNGYGQLGDWSTETRRTPVRSCRLAGVTAIAGGGYHTAALRADGTVWAWGRNDNGQLGAGVEGERSLIPAQIPGLTATKLRVATSPKPAPTRSTSVRAGKKTRTKPIPTSPPVNAKPGDTWVCPKDGSKMVYVPAGSFTMGGGHANAPKHSRQLKSYWIDVFEVTNKQFRTFVQRTHYHVEGFWEADGPPEKDNSPAIGVNWKDARAYAKWTGKRLPTEAEWERAARGTDGRAYPWGNEWDPSFAVLGKQSFKDVENVGTHPKDRSPVGCYDMAGNAQEWCFEHYSQDAYSRHLKGDDRVVTIGYVYSVRSQGADGGKESAGVDHRCWATPGWGRCGFRCAIGPEPPSKPYDIDYPGEINPGPRIYRTPGPPKMPKPGDLWICPKNGAEMTFVPGGEAKLHGSKRTMKVGPIWIGRYPVTVEQYRKFLAATHYEPIYSWFCYDIIGHENHPACGLAFEDAEAYSKWVGQRMPKTDEWLMAATGLDGRAYPWGNKPGDRLFTPFLGEDGTVPIGTRPFGQSPYGCYDMCSCNYEWTDSTDRTGYTVNKKTNAKERTFTLVSAWPDATDNERTIGVGWSGGTFIGRHKDGKTYPTHDWGNQTFRCVLDAR